MAIKNEIEKPSITKIPLANLGQRQTKANF